MQYEKKSSLTMSVWFVAGFGAFILTRTNTMVPVAILVASIFIIKFLRSSKPGTGILLTLAGFIVSLQVALPGPFIDSGSFLSNFLIDIIKDLIFALIFALPYFTDRFLTNKMNGFTGTLVFPVSAVLFYFLKSKTGLYDGVPLFYIYSQYGNMPLVQFMSIAGIWGMVFIISWFASAINWIWENHFDWNKIKKGTLTYVSIFTVILFYGGLKISPHFFEYNNKSVKIASVVFKDNDHNFSEILGKRIFTDIKNRLAKIDSIIKKAVENNAKIVAFQELSILIKKEDEQNMLNELKKIAEKNRTYLCMNYVVFPKLLDIKHEKMFGYTVLSDREEGRNKAVLIDDHGKIVLTTVKRHFALGETIWIDTDPGTLSVAETPYGKISIVVCRDMEFPDYLRNAGKLGADIVIAPSYEAARSNAITYMQMLRAVEYGFSFVRPCANGLSIAIDYNGTVLSSMNAFTTTGEIMYADVPVKGIWTLYTLTGDLFAWLCVAAFIFFIILIIKKGCSS